MRIALVIGKHQSIIRIRQILKLENFDLAEGIFGASGIFTRVLAGAYTAINLLFNSLGHISDGFCITRNSDNLGVSCQRIAGCFLSIRNNG